MHRFRSKFNICSISIPLKRQATHSIYSQYYSEIIQCNAYNVSKPRHNIILEQDTDLVMHDLQTNKLPF